MCQVNRAFRALAFVAAICGLVACSNSNPSATNDQAVITLAASPSKVPLRGRSTIVALGVKKTGAPIWDRVLISWTVDRGRIEPQQAEFKDGRAQATYFAPDEICEAEIDATSGTVDIAAIPITVGTAVDSVVITASRTSLPETGGTVVLRAIAYDDSSNPVPRTPVVFAATAGSLDSGGRAVTTNASGVAKDRLTTTTDASVTARSGSAESAAVQITVEEPAENVPPTAVVVFSPSAPLVGDTVYFNGEKSTDEDGRIVRWQWDFGDGTTGSGKRSSHAYAAAATYRVVLCVTDDDGARGCDSTEVTVAEPPDDDSKS